MSALHKQLLLAEVTPGMVLADNLLDAQGQILLPKGATLTAQTINSMRRHDVVSIPVVIGELTAEEDAVRRQEAQARLTYLFRRSEDNEINHLLHQYVDHFRSGEVE